MKKLTKIANINQQSQWKILGQYDSYFEKSLKREVFVSFNIEFKLINFRKSSKTIII
jgi:hypothetical protein